MDKRNGWTRFLAIAGTALVWLPLLAPVLISAVMLLQTGYLRFDYLMPAELFGVALLGGALLGLAARRAGPGLRAHRARLWISWSILASLVLLFGLQGLAVVTGLASGETNPETSPWTAVVTAMLGGYSLALLACGTGGVMLAAALRPGNGTLTSADQRG